MRPIKLVIKGINSYADEQTVDFEAMQSYGLFGIFGPTGSGKTTIIDGMTMALYGMGCMARESKDFINSDCDKAFVGLEFLAGRGERKVYSIERVFKRKKGGGTQTDSVRLCHLDGSGQIYDRLSDVQAQVEEIIGLSPDDFMRSVVLPQGKFSEFLKLKGSDRRAMLERLLGLEAYGEQLRIKTNGVKTQMEKDIEYIRGNLMPFEEITAEGLETVEVMVKESTTALESVSGRLHKERSVCDEMKTLLDKTQRFDTLKISMDALNAQQEVMTEERAKLADIRAAAELEPTQTRLLELEQHIHAEVLNLQTLEKQASENRQLLETAETDYKNCREDYETYYQPRLDQANRFKQAVAMEMDRSTLRQSNDQTLQQLERVSLESQQIEETLKALDAQIAENQQKTMAHEKKQNELTISSEIRTVLQELSSQEEKLRGLEERKLELVERIESAKTRQLLDRNALNQLALEQQQISESAERAETEKSRLQRQIDRMKLLAEVATQSSKVDTQKEIVRGLADQIRMHQSEEQRIRLRVEELSKTIGSYERVHALHLLSEQLEDGQNCPLCGSSNHPSPFGTEPLVDEESTAEVVRSALEEKQEKQQALERIMGSMAALNAEMTLMNQQLVVLEAELQSLGELDLLKVNVETDASQEGEPPGENFEKELFASESKLQELIQTSNASRDQMVQNQTHQERLSKDLDERLQVLQEMEKQHAEWVQAHDEINQANQQRLLNMKAIFENMLQKEALQTLRHLGIESLKDFKTLVHALEELQETVAKALMEKRRQTTALETERQSKQQEQMDHASQKSALEAKRQSVKEQLEAMDLQLKAFEGMDIKTELQQLEQWLQHVTDALPKLRSTYEQLNETAKNLNNSLLTQQTAYQGRLEESVRLGSLIEKGVLDKFGGERARFEKAIAGLAQMTSIEARIQAFEKEQVVTATALATLATELNGKRVDKPDYEAQEILVTELSERVKQLNVEIAMLQGKAQDWQAKLTEKNGLNKQLSHLNSKLDQVLEIVKLLKGNKFVEFIALGHMKSIAADASKRLLDITAGRYALEIGGDGGFVICDRNAGGVLREANSLSGGETFVASLALALSLSYHFQLKGRTAIDFFILDEGFGTLDRELLDTVMTALEKLKGDRMMVGVVSHVEEIKQRLPVRLEVTPAVPGLTGSAISLVKN